MPLTRFKQNKVYVPGRHIESKEVPCAIGISYPFPPNTIPVELFGMPKKSFYQHHTVNVDDVYPYYESFARTGSRSRTARNQDADEGPDTSAWSSSFKDNMTTVRS